MSDRESSPAHDERVDGMGDIERIWITGGEFGGDKIVYDEASAAAWRKHGYTVQGPFVRADDERGAVSRDDVLRFLRACGYDEAVEALTEYLDGGLQ